MTQSRVTPTKAVKKKKLEALKEVPNTRVVISPQKPAPVVNEPVVPPVVSTNPAPTEPARAVTAEPASTGGLSWSGYFDAYYAYSFGKPGTTASPTSPNTLRGANIPLRYYDRNHDQITLNLMELTVKKEAAPIGFQADIGFGQWIDQNVVTDEITKHLSQAFVIIAPKAVSGLTVQVGKMGTHLGLEVTHAQDNFNYSRSVTYGYALPFWHIGAKANMSHLDGKLNTMVALYNGWSVDSFDNNSGKTFGASVNGTPKEGLSLFYNFIIGPEANNSQKKIRTTHDFNATWEIVKAFTVAGDLVLGKDREAGVDQTWTAYEILAKFKPLDYFWVAPRFEQFDDAHGIMTGTVQKLTTFTLTATMDWGSGFETRAEYRYDKSNQNAFTDGGVATDKQNTVSLSALYKF